MAKLLPPSKSSIIKSPKSTPVKVDKLLNVNKPSVEISKSSSLLKDTLTQIENKVIKIDKLLKDSLFLSKKENEKSRIKKERKEFSEKEKQLEKKLPKPEKEVKLPSAPNMGFFGWIKNFITQTILGFFAVRLIEFLPQLLKILPVIINVSDFVIDWGGKLLDGLITFVDWGYKAIDGTRQFIKNIGGEGWAQNFDKFAGAIDNLIEVAVIAALVTAGSGGDGFGGKGVDPKRGFDSKGRRVGVDAQRRYAQRFGRDQFVDRFGRGNLGSLQGGARRGAFQQGVRNAFVGLAGKGGAKSILKFVRPLTKRIPIIGGLLDFGLSVALGEDPGRAAFKAIGATLVGAVGAAIGSLAFGVGGIIGGIIGGIGGDALGGALYDMIFKNKKPTPKQGKSNKLAGGGAPMTRSPKSSISTPKRTLKKKKTKRSLSFVPVKIKPGRSAGGEEKVQKVFPNPEKPKSGGFFGWLGGLFGGNRDQTQQTQEVKPKQQKPKQKVANPQEFLVKSNEILGRTPSFGPIFTLAIKTVLGDTPTWLDYLNVGKGLNDWTQSIFSTGSIGFSGGGEVDAKSFFQGEDYTNVIARSVQDSVSKNVDKTIKNLRDELALRSIREETIQEKGAADEEGGGELGEGEGVQVSSDSPDFWLLATAAMFENSHPQGAADVAQVIYNRVAMPGDPWKVDNSIKKAILNPNQFQPVRQYGGYGAWSRIKTKEDAIRFAKSHGKTQAMLETVAAAILDKSKQNSARQFVGPRDSFRSVSYENSNNHLADETEVRRHGHVFGFEPRGATIGQFKAGKLSAAQVNAGITGKVDYTGENISMLGGGGNIKFGETGNVSNAKGWVHGHFQGSDPRSVVRDTSSVVKALLRQGSPVFLNPGIDLDPKKQYSDSEIMKYVEKARRAHTHSGTGSSIDVFVKKGTKVPVPLTNIGPSGPGFGGYGRGGIMGFIKGTRTWIGHLDPSALSRSRQKQTASKFHGGVGIVPHDGFALKLHKGEMYKVVDKDSVDLFGFDLIKEIIDIENKSQLIARAPSIIEKLKTISNYPEEDGITTLIEVPIEIEVPVPMQMSGSTSIAMRSGDIDNSGMDILDVIG